MNTIEGLKKLPSIIPHLLIQKESIQSQLDSIQSQVDACYKPFKDIIEEAFLAGQKSPAPGLYVDYISFSVRENFVYFVIRNHFGVYDDAIEATYEIPIEAFVSVDTFREYIADGKGLKDE